MTVSQELETKECPVCGMLYAAPLAFMNKQRELGVNAQFYCPQGHKLHFSESSAKILQREKDALEQKLQAQLNEARHAQLVAQKERDKAIRDKRKVERRIAHGVCPCCNKTFSDIAQHMITEHKDFRLPAGKAVKAIAARREAK